MPFPVANRHLVSSLLVILFLIIGASHAGEVKQRIDGLTLNANLTLAENKTLKDGVILITHGTLAHGRMEITTAFQALFAENGYNSLAINLSLGLDDRHGMYDCGATHRHRHTDAVDEIGHWIDWLKQQGTTSIALLGHSRGGNQSAWYSAERADAIVNKVILVAPATWSEAYADKDYMRRYGKTLAPLLATARSMVAGGNGSRLLDPVDFIYCKETRASADAFLSYYTPDPRRDTPFLIPKIKLPVLVIAGSEDKVVKGLIEAVTPLAESSRVTLEVIDGAGHMFRDIYGEEAVELAIGFLEE